MTEEAQECWGLLLAAAVRDCGSASAHKRTLTAAMTPTRFDRKADNGDNTRVVNMRTSRANLHPRGGSIPRPAAQTVTGGMAVKLFLDTNSLLHYPLIRDVDWKAVCGSPSVRLLLCLQVIQELDEKKTHALMGDRAHRTIKEIEGLLEAGGAVKEGVSLEVFHYSPRVADFPSSMSPDNDDDKIVHSVKNYMEQHPGAAVAVYTEDLGMIVRCKAHGLTVVKPDKNRRLPTPLSEEEKKNRQLVNELNALKNRMPKLSVRVVPTGAVPSGENVHELSKVWQAVDVQAELARIKSEHPKQLARVDHPLYGLRSPLQALISPERWDRYDKKLETFYGRYEAYVDLLNTWREIASRTLRFDLWLVNTGNSPAQDVDLELLLPAIFKGVVESTSKTGKMLQSEPGPPEPPEEPTPRFPSAALDFSYVKPLPSVADQLGRILAEREQQKVEVHPFAEDGFMIHANVKRLKHGDPRLLGTFFAAFRDWSSVGPFQATYTISASEIPQKVPGNVPFIVRKKEGG
jgi:hypothetical protein